MESNFPTFCITQEYGARLAGVSKRTLRSWLDGGELGSGVDGLAESEMTSHQAMRAAALAQFKTQKKVPFHGSMARQPILDAPYVVVLTGGERVPITVTVDELPRYLQAPISVVVFDARPASEALRRQSR